MLPEPIHQRSGVGVVKVVKKRRGPAPKRISERLLREIDMKPIHRQEISWSHRQKIRTLVFLSQHKIPTGDELDPYRSPTQQEASDIFRVPQKTISEWVRKEKEIEKRGNGTKDRTIREVNVICWPDLESQLYKLFLEQREKGQTIRRSWFRVNSLFLFRQLYLGGRRRGLDMGQPGREELEREQGLKEGGRLRAEEVQHVEAGRRGEEVFRFSHGWFSRFLARHRISLRNITKKAQCVPAEYRNLILSWLRFNRRNSQPERSSISHWSIMMNPTPAVGRFQLSNICNLDETPIPFEYLDGRTYEPIGAKTVWAKSTRSGWDKRQASLVLCVFADGVPRIPPMVIFHGTGQRLGDEFNHYHSGVLVEFNEKAYMNDTLFLRYITDHLAPALEGRPSLSALDLMGSHKTPAVLDTLQNHQIIPSLIPGGCTSLLQPLDVSINKPLKEIMRDLTDQAILDCEEAEDIEKWTIRQRRILTTWCVGDAFYKFHTEKSEIISRAFRKVGLSLPPDGSCDSELDIKGFTGLEIGNWEEDGGLGSGDVHADIGLEHDNHETIEFLADGDTATI